MSDVNQVLDERGTRYGEFVNHAKFAQDIKDVMRCAENWNYKLENDQKEALEMIAHKIARILNGDPNYADNWIDIAGYATLVTRRLES